MGAEWKGKGSRNRNGLRPVTGSWWVQSEEKPRACSEKKERWKMFEKKMDVKLIGVAPMLMHNQRTCNPLDKYAKEMKEITGRRKKTDKDLEDLSKLEFMAGLYHDEKGYYIPSEQIEMMIASHANAVCKIGKNSLIADLTVEYPFYLDSYDGPESPEERFLNPNCVDVRSVRIQKNRVMRTRPVFKNWTASGRICFSDAITADQIKKMLDRGCNTGLGDFRPKFGRFQFEVIEPKGKK